MFCKKCGQEISGDQKFCPMCGATVTPPNVNNMGFGSDIGAAPTGAPTPANKPPYLALGLIGGVALIALIVLIVIFKAIFGGGYEKPIKNFFKAVENQDAGLMMSVFPDEYFEYLDDEFGTDIDEFEEYMEETLEDAADMYQDDMEIQYEIKDESDLRTSDIEDIEDYCDNAFKIKEGKEVEVKVKIYVDGKREESDTLTLNVIKVGSKWYLDPTSTSIY